MSDPRAWLADELGVVLDEDGKAPFVVDGVPYVLSIRESPYSNAFDLVAWHGASDMLVKFVIENEPGHALSRVLDRFREHHRGVLAWADAVRAAATPTAL